MSSRAPLVTVVVGAALALAACSSSGPAGDGGTKTVYVDPTSASVSAPASSTAPSPTESLSKPSSMSALGGQCEGKLPLSLVASATGEDLPGKTAFVVGTADASIHRKSYINCRYGLADVDANPSVEIQVSLYGTDAQASARIAPTVNDYKDNGATATQATVAGNPATILTGGGGTDYLNTTLIMAFGQRTVAVGVSDAIAADKQEADLTKLAYLALKRTQ